MAALSRREHPFPNIPFRNKNGKINHPTWEQIEKNHDEQEKALKALIKCSKTLPKGEVVGAVIAFGVADGAAYYIVTKANPLTVAHIPYGDNYHVNGLMIRGLRKSDVKDYKY